MVRESWEFAAAVVAEAREIPLARVGLGLAAGEELTARLAAPAVDALRRAVGLAPDPDGDRLRAPAYLTMVPAALEDAHAPARTHRFRPEAAVARAQEEAAGGGAPRATRSCT
jgi:hypothetical protein